MIQRDGDLARTLVNDPCGPPLPVCAQGEAATPEAAAEDQGAAGAEGRDA